MREHVKHRQDHPDPDHGFFRPENADFENVEGQEGHDEIKRKGNSKLGDVDKEYSLVLNFKWQQSSQSESRNFMIGKIPNASGF